MNLSKLLVNSKGVSNLTPRALTLSKQFGISSRKIENRLDTCLSITGRFDKETYSKARLSLADISLFESALDELGTKGMVKYFLAQYNGSYIGAIGVLLYKGVIYDWYAGADPSFLLLYPNETLVRHVLKWGAENGYHTFDFGGAGKPNEKYGVRDFKARFGGALVNYGRYYKVYNPLALRISKSVYGLYRKFL